MHSPEDDGDRIGSAHDPSEELELEEVLGGAPADDVLVPVDRHDMNMYSLRSSLTLTQLEVLSVTQVCNWSEEWWSNALKVRDRLLPSVVVRRAEHQRLVPVRAQGIPLLGCARLRGCAVVLGVRWTHATRRMRGTRVCTPSRLGRRSITCRRFQARGCSVGRVVRVGSEGKGGGLQRWNRGEGQGSAEEGEREGLLKKGGAQ